MILEVQINIAMYILFHIAVNFSALYQVIMVLPLLVKEKKYWQFALICVTYGLTWVFANLYIQGQETILFKLLFDLWPR